MPYSDPTRQRAAMRAVAERRQRELDEIAQSVGWLNWSEAATAFKEHRAKLPPPSKRQLAHRAERARKEEEGGK